MEFKDKEDKKKVIPLGAWLPWLPLLILGFMAVTRANGLGGGLVPLAFYLPVSFLLGAIVVFLYRKNKAAKNVAALILFGGPAFALMIEQTESRYRVSSAKAAQEMLREYCAEQAGSVVYRTAKDVEGVFQMEYREDYSLENASRDDVPDPWYQNSLNTLRSFGLGIFGGGYFFMEKRASLSQNDSTISRVFLAVPEDRRAELLELPGWQAITKLKRKAVQVESIRSKYGWRSKNLTTSKMRKYWITGGSIEIVDLKNEEVMAELTSFYLGKGGLTRADSWSLGERCKNAPRFTSFIREVLKPVGGLPSFSLTESLEAH
ncbi:MAG: hypothetical protein AB8B48_11015 [Pseudomonadales bacterium]